MHRQHVAIVTPIIAARLLSGEKTIESRLYRSRRPPFGIISPGDTIYFRSVGGPIFARSIARSVQQHIDLTPARVAAIRRTWSHQIAAHAGYWKAKRHCRFAVLIWLGRLRPASRHEVTAPRQFGSAWITIREAD
ncbi:MAG: hypothetical protein ACKVS9_06960 [Phycisphaerae bacterium]